MYEEIYVTPVASYRQLPKTKNPHISYYPILFLYGITGSSNKSVILLTCNSRRVFQDIAVIFSSHGHSCR